MQEATKEVEIELPAAVYTASVADLYIFIAKKVVEFAKAQNITGAMVATGGGPGSGAAAAPPPIGFCFSFPMQQTSIRGCVCPRF